MFVLLSAGRSQSDDNVGDQDQTNSKNKKNSNPDLTQRNRNQADTRNAAKDSGKVEKTATGTKRKALNSRSGKEVENWKKYSSDSLIKL